MAGRAVRWRSGVCIIAAQKEGEEWHLTRVLGAILARWSGTVGGGGEGGSCHRRAAVSRPVSRADQHDTT